MAGTARRWQNVKRVATAHYPPFLAGAGWGAAILVWGAHKVEGVVILAVSLAVVWLLLRAAHPALKRSSPPAPKATGPAVQAGAGHTVTPSEATPSRSA